MKHYFYGLLFILLPLSVCTSKTSENRLVLQYTSPAAIWEATLPLGNGRIGMMPDGGIDTEHIVLNDIAMWSGSEDPEALNPEAIRYLPEIRKLLLEGKNLEAQNIMYRHFRCGGKGSAFGQAKDAPYGCFQMLGDLHIRYSYPNNDPVDNYRRTLSLNDAVAYTHFQKGNTKYTREYFASFANDILVIRLSSNKKKAIGFELTLTRPERATISIKNNVMYMEGQLNDGYNTDKGVRYLTKLQILNKGGTLASENSSLSLTDADEAIILISTSTDMLDKNYRLSVNELLSKGIKTPYKKLKGDHIGIYRDKFDRVELNLGKQNNDLPTDERLKDFQQSNDPSFAALYFQFGRYLMISGTRENSLPLNLQGMWANTIQTPWNGDYHLNINVQMNYWPAEVCNLSDLHTPLLNFTQALVPSGAATAKTFYGAEGWVAHVITNPWRFTAPAEHASWGATNTGGAWLCQHLWEHYAFTQDSVYLRTIYPILKGAADFFLTNMIEEPTHGWLVTAPSSSPENAFYLPGSKEPVYVCMGPTMDVEIIGELFDNVLKAAEILDIRDETVEKIKAAKPKLPPLQISPKGYLQEWLYDYEEVDPHHRHVSHLYALYPSNRISPHKTPQLAEAARKTLERRGDGGTGWSRAWKISFWARLHDGNRAYKLLKNLLHPAIDKETSMSGQGGGTYPNLFCAHPPFQIDGNFGGTAGIAEMLIQSQDGYIELLPALPDNWATGSFKGLCVRGGGEVNAHWKNKKATSITIRSHANHTFKIKIPPYAQTITLNKKTSNKQEEYISLPMKKGDIVVIDINSGE
ncbi:MAG: glycoside hydrolase family 95 protein [Dysgonamonadaceae bacterium]